MSLVYINEIPAYFNLDRKQTKTKAEIEIEKILSGRYQRRKIKAIKLGKTSLKANPIKVN